MQHMAKYYLVVGTVGVSRAHKLCDCVGQIEGAEHQAVEVLKEYLRRGKANRSVRVVEADSGIVQFAVHEGNLGNLAW